MDPIESAIASEHDRQERAWREAMTKPTPLEALKPLANIADWYMPEEDDRHTVFSDFGSCDAVTYLTLGEARAARDALPQAEQQEALINELVGALELIAKERGVLGSGEAQWFQAEARIALNQHREAQGMSDSWHEELGAVSFDDAVSYLAHLLDHPTIKRPHAQTELFAARDFGLLACGHNGWGHYWYLPTPKGEAAVKKMKDDQP